MTFKIILGSLFAVFLTQVIKLIIDARQHKFSWHDLNRYGGMPSSHTAFVVTLAILTGYYEYWNSAAFAIATVLAILTIRDAAGFRRNLGKHAEELNKLISEIKPEKSYEFERLSERLGHTPLQVFVGAMIGIVVAVLVILI
ncbi:MAG: divergent PAP2 family protein [Patescibacteria group bacterium]